METRAEHGRCLPGFSSAPLTFSQPPLPSDSKPQPKASHLHTSEAFINILSIWVKETHLKY